MPKIIVVVGFGPGNSTAIAAKFGTAGFTVAIVGRNAERLAAGVAGLKARGIAAAAFTGDAADADSMRATIRRIHAELGPITVLHWNAFGGENVGDLLAADSNEVRGVFDVAVVGLLAALREALPDLKSAGDGALLVTNGGFGDATPETDTFVTSIHAPGIGLANAAKNKLAGLLAERLKGEASTSARPSSTAPSRVRHRAAQAPSIPHALPTHFGSYTKLAATPAPQSPKMGVHPSLVGAEAADRLALRDRGHTACGRDANRSSRRRR